MSNGNGNNSSGSGGDASGSGGMMSKFMKYLQGLDWGDAASAGAAWKMWEDMREDLKDFGTSAQEGSKAIGDQAAADAAFRPFTVTGVAGDAYANYGSGEATYYTQADVDAGTLPPGAAIGDVKTEAYTPGLELKLSEDQQLFSDWYKNLTSGLMTDYSSEYGGDDWRETKEQGVYDRIMAAQEGGRERDRLALESRLLGQGRLGTKTSMFGGTPEQLALAKAQEEQALNAVLAAMTRASTEQQEDFSTIGQSLGMQYAPEQYLLSTLAPGINIASLADTARRQGAGYKAETGMAGLDAALKAMLGRGNLTGSMMESLLMPRGEGGSSLFGSLVENVGGGIWDMIFGGGDD